MLLPISQLELGAAAIGGKDSMSGSFMDLDVPPTLISFAIAPAMAGDVVSTEFKEAGHPVYCIGTTNLSDYDAHKAAWEAFHALVKAGKVKAAWAIEGGGVAEAVMKMSFGNGVGFTYDKDAGAPWFGPCPGMIVAELSEEIDLPYAAKIGMTNDCGTVTLCGETATVEELM